MKGSAMMSIGKPSESSGGRSPAPLDQLIKLESEATQIFLNQPLFVPGLLQVTGYATEMISRITGLAPGSPELAEQVKTRMKRAEGFTKRSQGVSPPHLWAAIDEAVLRRTVGGATVMREQLDHLVVMSKMDTVNLAVIPLSYGAHPGLAGSFEVHERAGGDATVFIEGVYADEVVVGDQALAQLHTEKVKALFASAVSGAEAQELLEGIAGTL